MQSLTSYFAHGHVCHVLFACEPRDGRPHEELLTGDCRLLSASPCLLASSSWGLSPPRRAHLTNEPRHPARECALTHGQVRDCRPCIVFGQGGGVGAVQASRLPSGGGATERLQEQHRTPDGTRQVPAWGLRKRMRTTMMILIVLMMTIRMITMLLTL